MLNQTREKPEPKISISVGPQSTWLVSVGAAPKKGPSPLLFGFFKIGQNSRVVLLPDFARGKIFNRRKKLSPPLVVGLCIAVGSMIAALDPCDLWGRASSQGPLRPRLLRVCQHRASHRLRKKGFDHGHTAPQSLLIPSERHRPETLSRIFRHPLPACSAEKIYLDDIYSTSTNG
jgi:hypothetical protein